MRRLISRCARIIGRAGGEVFLLREDKKIPFAASIQPQRNTAPPDMHPTGWGAGGLYVLYTTVRGAGGGLSPEDSVEFLGRRYRVLAVEDYTFSGRMLYRKGLLKAESGEDF